MKFKKLLVKKIVTKIKLVKTLLIGLLCSMVLSGYAAEHGDEHIDENGSEHAQPESEAGTVELKNNSEILFKVKIRELQLTDVAKQLVAPAEVKLNAYKTAIVAQRVSGQIVKRLVKMGDEVEAGQALAIISSIPMSEAQQGYIVNVKEWQRVKQLGRKVVSGKRYIEARSQWQSSKARLLAYGLDEKQLKQLEKQQNPAGLFNINTPIAGVVMSDEFIEGQYAEAGFQLFVVSDESVIWVEASVSPDQAALFKAGDLAEIEHAGERHSGKVVQIGHTVSETTRTQKIRIEIDNSKDDLHPGQFVTAKISQSQSEKKVVLPESALVKTADGDWGVFVAIDFKQTSNPRHFKQMEVEVTARHGDLMVIEGIELGTPVVIEGAFYLSAELAKAGFDPHGH